MTKKERIVIALDGKYIEQLNDICVRLKTKQKSKAIKYILDILNINMNI